MADFFKLLAGGARFNNKKYSSDFEPFHSRAETVDTDHEPTELNFFNPAKKLPALLVEAPALPLETEVNHVAIESTEQATQWRKQHHIRVYGEMVPFPFATFSELSTRYSFKSYLQKNLLEAEYKNPTPIQMQAAPVMIEGRELMACAPTGSGKTLAFLIGIMHYLKNPSKDGFRALIVTPTRELGQQIFRDFKKLSKNKPFKVLLLSKATNSAESVKSHDLLISTPLRLIEALDNNHIKLDKYI